MRKRLIWTWGGGGFLLGAVLALAACARFGLPVPAGTLPVLWVAALVWAGGCAVALLAPMGQGHTR